MLTMPNMTPFPLSSPRPHTLSQSGDFNHTLAEECARAFSASTGLGCTVSDVAGHILYEHGNGCGSCQLCRAAGLPPENCIQAHIYGMTEAERFGGKYIYFCPLGLTCFVSPIIGEEGSTAKITVGPLLMVDLQDFIDCELSEFSSLTGEARASLIRLLEQVPSIPPEKVQELSVLLFMAVGFMNNVSAENRLLENARSDLLQGQIGAYISQLKTETHAPAYPFAKERELLQAISACDKKAAHRLMQELLGAILASGGGNLEWMKARVAELIVLISRTAIENGAEETPTLHFNAECLNRIPSFSSFRALSSWLTDITDNYMDRLFSYPDAKHANLIHRCIQYIGANYAGRLTLEDTARAVSLSPDYLSRIFRQETGNTFNHYLNQVRITKAKELIRHSDLRLTDISQMVGYDDQSYFTKVFRRLTGTAPNAYRKKTRTARKVPNRTTDFEIHAE